MEVENGMVWLKLKQNKMDFALGMLSGFLITVGVYLMITSKKK